MQLKKIQDFLEKYKKYLQTDRAYELLHWWEAQKNWQENWDLETENLAETFDKSLQNSETKRLWKREAYHPKQVMLDLIALQPDFAMQMFKDLFRESKEPLGRVDRFMFYSDQMLADFKKQNPNSIENNHYQDYGIISLYLAFEYPNLYGFYDYKKFHNCLQQLGAANITENEDIARFFKTSRTLFNFMKKDPEIFALHQVRLDGTKHYMGESMLMVSELMVVTENVK